MRTYTGYIKHKDKMLTIIIENLVTHEIKIIEHHEPNYTINTMQFKNKSNEKLLPLVTYKGRLKAELHSLLKRYIKDDGWINESGNIFFELFIRDRYVNDEIDYKIDLNYLSEQYAVGKDYEFFKREIYPLLKAYRVNTKQYNKIIDKIKDGIAKGYDAYKIRNDVEIYLIRA